MTTEIERYLNSLSNDILTIDISCKGIKSLPDLTKFKKLETLHCSNNILTSLPTLPQSLQNLYCSNNNLTLLPTLPQSLQNLYCSYNKLALLPTLPQNLQKLHCSNNKLNSFPTLPQNIQELHWYNNPISEIVNTNRLINIKLKIQILNNFRCLYYSLKFKKQLRKWLWEKVREPKIKKLYDPIYLINLKEDDDLDTFLDNWK